MATNSWYAWNARNLRLNSSGRHNSFQISKPSVYYRMIYVIYEIIRLYIQSLILPNEAPIVKEGHVYARMSQL